LTISAHTHEEVAVRVTVYNVLPRPIKEIIAPVVKEAKITSPKEIFLSREIEPYFG
jgi:hypothetical protein